MWEAKVKEGSKSEDGKDDGESLRANFGFGQRVDVGQVVVIKRVSIHYVRSPGDVLQPRFRTVRF